MSRPQASVRPTGTGTDAALARELESTCGGGDILNARARAVENRDLIRPRPAAAAADDQIPSSAWTASGVIRPPDGVVQIAMVAHCARMSATTVAAPSTRDEFRSFADCPRQRPR